MEALEPVAHGLAYLRDGTDAAGFLAYVAGARLGGFRVRVRDERVEGHVGPGAVGEGDAHVPVHDARLVVLRHSMLPVAGRPPLLIGNPSRSHCPPDAAARRAPVRRYAVPGP
jgi:hypothetical protein